MKYIYELTQKQYKEYNIIAKKRTAGIISDQEFKKELKKIVYK